MSCSGFTVALKSRDRVTGDANSYSIALPALPRGSYKATFQVGADVNDTTELCVRWPGATRAFQSNRGDAFASVVTFLTYESSGVLYIDDPASTVDVAFNSAATGQVTTTMPESIVHVIFEPVQ